MSYASVVLADTPVGYWKLDEASGTTCTDYSGNGRNIGYQGTPHFQIAGPVASDSPSYGIGFDAVNYENAWVSTPSWAALSNVTIELWYRTTATVSGYTRIFGYGVNTAVSTSTYLLYMVSGGLLRASFYMNGTTVTLSYATAINDGIWRHLAFGVSAKSDPYGYTLHVNGAQEAGTVYSSGTIGTGLSPSGAFRIGAADTTNTIAAEYAHAALYSSRLSAAKIAAHYAAASAGVISPSEGRLFHTGYAPSIAQPRWILPSNGVLVVSGNTPSLLAAVTRQPSTAKLS